MSPTMQISGYLARGLFCFTLALLQNSMPITFPSTIEPAATERFVVNTRTEAPEVNSALRAPLLALPLAFELNQGQTNKSVKFLARAGGYLLFLTANEAVMSFSNSASDRPRAGDEAALHPKDAGEQKPRQIVRMSFVGADPTPAVAGIERLENKSNYFGGSDPAGWRTNIPNYSRVRYAQVYPGIDLDYYGNQRQLEYDFSVAPGADPTAVKIAYEGVEDVRISTAGDLILRTKDSEIRQLKPVAYQNAGGERREVAVSYVSKGLNMVGFQLGDYDRSKDLIIDPVLVYSTYLGGAGYDTGNAIAVDRFGSAYVTGAALNANFPTTPGAFQTNYGGYDAFVAKFSTDGRALVYSTYINGATGTGIAVDLAGNAYITGDADLPSFPTTPGAFQTEQWGFDTFVTKLNATGSALVYSARFGGNFDDFGRAIALDAAGNAYITGWTVCRATTCTYPVVNAFQPNYGGGYQDAFVTKINSSGSALIYSTYLGGGTILNADNDWGEGIAVDGAGSAYVTGQTYSPDFPITSGAYDTGRCGLDAFITKFAPDGRTLAYSTFLGGCSREQGMDVAVDVNGNAYVSGMTESSDNPFTPEYEGFPVTPGAYQRVGSFDAFVTKLNPQGSALVYSTYLGGTGGSERAWNIAIDADGNAYITGDTTESSIYSNNFPVVNAIQPFYGGGFSDAFLAKLNPAGTALVYSTYLGGNLSDAALGLAIDGSGNAYITGDTSSYDFPVTPGAFQMQNAGGMEHHDDAFVAKIGTLGTPTPGRTAFDYDGDRKSDISVCRPSTGAWYLLRSQAGLYGLLFGVSTDKITPADFDGDGKTDIAVYRPSNGVWYVVNSSNGVVNYTAFGLAGDLPTPADYDGDGKADISVFRPSSGTWLRQNSSNGVFVALQFGLNGDVPTMGDFDGDGKADIGVWRPSSGDWYHIRSSSGTVFGERFGVSTDKIVPADYDGDGKTDIAVYRASTGIWYVKNSSSSVNTFTAFGLSTDMPAPGDFDSDGKADISLFRPSDGNWYRLNSSTGAFVVYQFGANGDKPTQRAYGN